MGKTLEAAQPQVHVAQIQYHGEKMILPEGMSIEQAIDLLARRRAYENEDTTMEEVIDAFPYDGALALDRVLNEKYGWAEAVATPGFFGPTPPELKTIEIGPNQKKMVPWGRFVLPNIQGFLQTSGAKKGDRFVFKIVAQVRRVHERQIKELFQAVRLEAERHSIYRGKAIKIRFLDGKGNPMPMPEPKFLDTEKIDERMLVFPRHVQNAVQTNLFTPITRAQDCLRNGIPVKRGVLLGGTYGTGKTLAASVASKLAVQSNVTYIYVPRADELPAALAFAKQYQSPASVVFCEDIDRVMSGERSVSMDDILNTIDGIDSKTSNTIVVLTTNNLKAINPAMLRPGRLDAVIHVTPPDAEAVDRLIRSYTGVSLDPEANLNEVGEVLAGQIPAIIAEVVKRAKLSQLAIQPVGTWIEKITEAALLEAAHTMKAQIDLLRSSIEDDEKHKPVTMDKVLARIVREASNPPDMEDTNKRVRHIENHVCD